MRQVNILTPMDDSYPRYIADFLQKRVEEANYETRVQTISESDELNGLIVEVDFVKAWDDDCDDITISDVYIYQGDPQTDGYDPLAEQVRDILKARFEYAATSRWVLQQSKDIREQQQQGLRHPQIR